MLRGFRGIFSREQFARESRGCRGSCSWVLYTVVSGPPHRHRYTYACTTFFGGVKSSKKVRHDLLISYTQQVLDRRLSEENRGVFVPHKKAQRKPREGLGRAATLTNNGPAETFDAATCMHTPPCPWLVFERAGQNESRYMCTYRARASLPRPLFSTAPQKRLCCYSRTRCTLCPIYSESLLARRSSRGPLSLGTPRTGY